MKKIRGNSRGTATRIASILVMLVATATAACASTTRIGDLLAQPSRYTGKTVAVEGTVVRGAGLLGAGAYELEDGTGKIVVIAQGQGVPPQGARTKVKGRFESVFSFMGRSVAAIVQPQNGGRD